MKRFLTVFTLLLISSPAGQILADFNEFLDAYSELTSNHDCFWRALLAEFFRGHACHAFEEFGQERGVGEIHVVADAGDGLVGVLEVDFDAGDQGVVNPLFGALAAHLLDDCAHVSRCETQARGIEVDGVVLGGKLAHQLDEIGEQALLARLVLAVILLLTAPQVVNIPQEGAHQVKCDLAAAILLPQVIVKHQVQLVQVFLLGRAQPHLEVAQVPVEGVGDAIAHCQREQFVADRQANALHIAGGVLVLEDAVGAQKHQVTGLKASLHHVDDGIGPAVLDHEDTHLGHERGLFFDLLLYQVQSHVAGYCQVARDVVVSQVFIFPLNKLFELGQIQLS